MANPFDADMTKPVDADMVNPCDAEVSAAEPVRPPKIEEIGPNPFASELALPAAAEAAAAAQLQPPGGNDGGSGSVSSCAGALAIPSHKSDTSQADMEATPNFQNAPQCAICSVVFGTLNNRRHHCRICFLSVCDACSPNKISLSDGDRSTQIVCNPCARQLVRIPDFRRRLEKLSSDLQSALGSKQQAQAQNAGDQGSLPSPSAQALSVCEMALHQMDDLVPEAEVLREKYELLRQEKAKTAGLLNEEETKRIKAEQDLREKHELLRQEKTKAAGLLNEEERKRIQAEQDLRKLKEQLDKQQEARRALESELEEQRRAMEGRAADLVLRARRDAAVEQQAADDGSSHSGSMLSQQLLHPQGRGSRAATEGASSFEEARAQVAATQQQPRHGVSNCKEICAYLRSAVRSDGFRS
eukprot:TRINITY_DN8808_c0_g1_i2.p1 TRINITY_DN8808_c0_g1~~TRINITY_DN8808_c0_g1_i2.p1  ORF type:complete len:426 (-),score=112.10 TRINITY_DN8808_c0_g1_i2:10-1251(-)